MNALLADQPFTQITSPGSNPQGASIGTYSSAAEKIISNALAFLTIVGGIMFAIYFLLGGLQWITAGGDKGKIDAAKDMMTNGAIGLIIITLSYSIVWIVGKVVGFDILNPAIIINNMKFK